MFNFIKKIFSKEDQHFIQAKVQYDTLKQKEINELNMVISSLGLVKQDLTTKQEIERLKLLVSQLEG